MRRGILHGALAALVVLSPFILGSGSVRRAIASADRWMADKIDAPSIVECKVKRLTRTGVGVKLRIDYHESLNKLGIDRDACEDGFSGSDYVCWSKGFAPREECLDPKPSGGVLATQEPGAHESLVCAATPPMNPVVGLFMSGPFYCWPATVPAGGVR